MNGVKPKVPCFRCGECCREFSSEKGVILVPDDLSALSSRLSLSEAEFSDTYLNWNTITTGRGDLTIPFLKSKTGDCPFLENSLCRVFEVRPLQCTRAPLDFFWQGHFPYEYPCQDGITVPETWSSKESDKDFLSQQSVLT